MGIQLTEAGYYDLKLHIGHNVVVVGYKEKGSTDDPVNISIECEDCGEVILDFDQPYFEEDGTCCECGGETYFQLRFALTSHICAIKIPI